VTQRSLYIVKRMASVSGRNRFENREVLGTQSALHVHSVGCVAAASMDIGALAHAIADTLTVE